MVLFHPEWNQDWNRTCGDCQKNHVTPSGEVVRRVGLIMARPSNVPTPCMTCPKIPQEAPERKPEYAVVLSEKNWRAYTHYMECSAVGQFPDDPIVRRNARVIKMLRDQLESKPVRQILQFLTMFTPTTATK